MLHANCQASYGITTNNGYSMTQQARPINVAINGFGRIGRNVLRAVYETSRQSLINIVAINELAEPEGIAHLLKYDTSQIRRG